MSGDATREGLSAIVAAALGAALSFWLLPPAPAAFAALLAPLIVYVAVHDLRHLIIPDWAAALIAILGLAFAATQADASVTPWAITDGLLRMAAAGSSLLLLRLIYRLRSGAEGLGLGDVKLAAAGAPFVRWDLLPFVLAAAALGCALAILVRFLVTKVPLERRTEIPFGAFLGPAIWFALLLGQSGMADALWG
jgi:leader peptidase (prepilin peptidase)/N-methyltransferase